MDPQIVTVIVALVGSLGSILAFLAGRRERAANALASEGTAAAQISEGFANLVDGLEKRVTSLERENKELKVLVNEYKQTNESLTMLTKAQEKRILSLESKLQKLGEKVHNGLTNGSGTLE